MSDLLTRGRKALKRIVTKVDDEKWIFGTVGRLTDGVPTFDVVGRQGYLYVTIRQANGSQTSPPARNDGGVPKALGLPVRMRLEGRTFVIDSIARRSDLAYTSPGQDPSIHTHDSRYFTEGEITGAAALGAPADTDKFVAVRAGGLGSILWSGIKTALTTLFNALYVLVNGKSGGQHVYGGTDSGDDLTLESTIHATKGELIMPDNAIRYGSGTIAMQIFFNGVAGAVVDMIWQSAGVNRWIIRKDSTAESGGDVGSNLIINSRTDAGGSKVNVIIAERAGNVGLGGVVPLARVHIYQDTLNSAVLRIETETSGTNPFMQWFQNRIGTTTATPATLHTFAITAGTIRFLHVRVGARRTGGASGTGATGDGAEFELRGRYKNVGGTVTLIGALTSVADVEAGGASAAWTATLVISGTDVLVQVTGAASMNVTWWMIKAESSQLAT